MNEARRPQNSTFKDSNKGTQADRLDAKRYKKIMTIRIKGLLCFYPCFFLKYVQQGKPLLCFTPVFDSNCDLPPKFKPYDLPLFFQNKLSVCPWFLLHQLSLDLLI
jgi:hypothetical protein